MTHHLRLSILLATALLALSTLFLSCGTDEEPEESAACTMDSECSSTQRCDDGSCVTRACIPGASACDGAILLICDDAGQEQRMRCDDGQACLEEGAATASCVTQVCEPGESTCLNQRQVAQCNDAGTAREEMNCDDGLSCREGECVETPCEPFEVGCLNGTTAYSCDGAGVLTMLPCGDGESCSNSICSAQTCLPEQITCDGNTLVECNEDGTQITRTNCDEVPDCQNSPNGCICMDEACVAQ